MTSFLATDTFTPHDCYLELLAVDQIPSSAYGGRPNLFAVVLLERALSAPHTVVKGPYPDASTINGDHLSSKEIAEAAESYGRGKAEVAALSYNKFTQGSANAATNHPSAGTDALPSSQVMIPSALVHHQASKAASAGLGGSIRVARTNIIANAPLSVNLETKFCISNCHDREVLRITVYDQVESARGFLGTATLPIGGPLREYGSRLLKLEGPTAMTLQVSWEIGAVSSADLQQRYHAANEATHNAAAKSILATHRSAVEDLWLSRYGKAVECVSANTIEDVRAVAAESAVTAEPSASVGLVERTLTDENGNATAGLEGTSPSMPPPPGAITISAREAHLEQRVKELEDTLLAMAKNTDERVEKELLRRVAGGFAPAEAKIPTNASYNMMALTVQDLANVAAQGHGTLSQTLAQMAVTQRLGGLAMADGGGSPQLNYSGSPTVAKTIGDVGASQDQEKTSRRAYHDGKLMQLPRNQGGSANASSPLGDPHTCPNLLDIISNPTRKLHAAEEAAMMSYLGPHTLYQSDVTRYAATQSSLFGSHIDLPSLQPHHGCALPASQILGTDVLSAGMQRGLPPLLGTANVTSCMPLSYAKNTMKYHATPTLDMLASVYVAAPPTPLSPSKRVAFQQPELGGLAANNTVLNDIAISSMYPHSRRLIDAHDPLYQDNAAAWKAALANRDAHLTLDGAKITAPA